MTKTPLLVTGEMELWDDCPEEDENPAPSNHPRDEALEPSHTHHLPHGVLPRRFTTLHGQMGEGERNQANHSYHGYVQGGTIRKPILL